MKAEDQQVVETLKEILEDHDYLEYDETWTYSEELQLKVNVTETGLDTVRNRNIPMRIRSRLEDATNIKFKLTLGLEASESDNDDLNTEWTDFILTEERNEGTQ